MTRSLNVVVISGHTGQNPKFIQKDGKRIASFTVALDENYRKDEDWVEKTVWVNVTAYGGLAEYVNENLPSGSRVEIHDKLANNNYTDKHGQSRQDLFLEITSRGQLIPLGKKESSAE